MIWLLFFILTAGLLGSAIMVLYQKSAVHSALFLIMSFLFLAGFYLLLAAEFIAFVHIIVYAGAIMVLFLFVIMLLNLKEDVRGFVHGRNRQIVAIVLGGAVLFLTLVLVLSHDMGSTAQTISVKAGVSGQSAGNLESVGLLLFSRYVLPFEIASILLIVAMIGAVVLAKREL